MQHIGRIIVGFLVVMASLRAIDAESPSDIYVAFQLGTRVPVTERKQCSNVAGRSTSKVRWKPLDPTYDPPTFPKPWHEITQEALFMHLRRIWSDDCFRVFVDLGSLPGAGHFQNTSDGLIWLRYFNHSGIVLSLDANEHSALDVASRFRDAGPYNQVSPSMSREVLVHGIGNTEGGTLNMPSMQYISRACQCPNCQNWGEIEDRAFKKYGTFDHFCRSFRQRAGYYNDRAEYAALFNPPLPFDPRLAGGKHVNSTTFDRIWLEHLNGVHIDFLKMDVDRSWMEVSVGFQRLLENRAVSVFTFEIDPIMTRADVTSEVELFVDMMTKHDYVTFIKWPCGHFNQGYDDRYKLHRRDSPVSGVDYVNTAYLPISGKYAVQLEGVLPPRFRTPRHHDTGLKPLKLAGRKGFTVAQDLMAVDIRQTALVRELVRMGNADCQVRFSADFEEAA